MKSSTTKDNIINLLTSVLAVLTIYLILLILYLVKDNPLAFPSPNDIIKQTFLLFTKLNTYKNITLTILRLLLCVFISIILGYILSAISYKNKYIRKYINIIVMIFRTLPLVSIIILLIIIFGRIYSLYFIVCLMLIPISYQNILNGFDNIDKNVIDAYKLDSSYNIKVLFKIYTPLIKNDIKNTFIQIIGLGFKVLVMAEFLTGFKNSIGYELNNSYQNSVDLVYVYSWSLVLLIISLLITYLTNLIKDK